MLTKHPLQIHRKWKSMGTTLGIHNFIYVLHGASKEKAHMGVFRKQCRKHRSKGPGLFSSKSPHCDNRGQRHFCQKPHNGACLCHKLRGPFQLVLGLLTRHRDLVSFWRTTACASEGMVGLQLQYCWYPSHESSYVQKEDTHRKCDLTTTTQTTVFFFPLNIIHRQGYLNFLISHHYLFQVLGVGHTALNTLGTCSP